MILYHFTNKERVQLLKKEGISIGDVPTSPSEGYNAPWLTSDGRFIEQAGWANPAVCLFDKTTIRISVEVDENDPKLRTWRSLCVELSVPEWWQRALAAAGGHNGDEVGRGKPNADKAWYVYHGVITPDMFIAIDARPTTVSFGLGLRAGAILQRAVDLAPSAQHPMDTHRQEPSRAPMVSKALVPVIPVQRSGGPRELARTPHEASCKMAIDKGYHVPRHKKYQVLSDRWFENDIETEESKR